MCCEQLVCAACGGRVTDARCSTCVASRASVHGVSGSRMSPELLLLLLLLLALSAALVSLLRGL